MEKYPTPKSLRDMRGFLGLVNQSTFCLGPETRKSMESLRQIKENSMEIVGKSLKESLKSMEHQRKLIENQMENKGTSINNQRNINENQRKLKENQGK